MFHGTPLGYLLHTCVNKSTCELSIVTIPQMLFDGVCADFVILAPGGCEPRVGPALDDRRFKRWIQWRSPGGPFLVNSHALRENCCGKQGPITNMGHMAPYGAHMGTHVGPYGPIWVPCGPHMDPIWASYVPYGPHMGPVSVYIFQRSLHLGCLEEEITLRQSHLG